MTSKLHRAYDWWETGRHPHPVRIQRRRTKGWRMPEGAVYVGRPTRWGNPFRINVESDTSRPVAIGHYSRWLTSLLRSGTPFAQEFLDPLRGHDLVCWCPLDQPCHADVLLELANPVAVAS